MGAMGVVTGIGERSPQIREVISELTHCSDIKGINDRIGVIEA
jgi:hypothetical protein